MKRMITVMMAVAGISLFSFGSGFAAEGYGSAGCGLGSMVFGNEPGGIQVIAATVNATSYSQLFGITSGTSNCEKTPNSYSHIRLNEFVVANMDNLAKDVAKGHGESLETLAELIGISTEKRSDVYARLQSNFSNIFTSEKVEAGEVVDNILTVIGG